MKHTFLLDSKIPIRQAKINTIGTNQGTLSRRKRTFFLNNSESACVKGHFF